MTSPKIVLYSVLIKAGSAGFSFCRRIAARLSSSSSGYFFFLRPVFTAWKSLYHSPRPYGMPNFHTRCEKSNPAHRRRPMSGIRFFAGIACVWHEKMTKSGRWVSAAQPRAMNSASSAAWPVSSCHRSSFVLSSVKLPVPFSYCRASFSTPCSLSVSVTQRQSS